METIGRKSLDKIFSSVSGSSMDELFTRYMYYERAKMQIKKHYNWSIAQIFMRKMAIAF